MAGECRSWDTRLETTAQAQVSDNGGWTRVGAKDSTQTHIVGLTHTRHIHLLLIVVLQPLLNI